jgi:DNA-directed RNA polymerase subunit beta'
MRTFHTGGVAGKYLTGVAEVKKKKQESLRELHDDIRKGLVSIEEGVEGMEREKVRAVQAVLKVLEDQVRGLLRVVELFEARKPKGQAIITEVGGKVVDIETKGLKRVVIHTPVSTANWSDVSGEVAAEDIIDPHTGEPVVAAGSEVTDKIAKKLPDMGVETVILRKTHLVPYRGNLEVEPGMEVRAGDRLTEGPLDPQKVLELQGVHGIMEYLVREIQQVYKSQGVDINDKHVEVIVRQMLKKRKVLDPGDTDLLPGQTVDKFELQGENQRVEMAGGRPARAEYLLLGITEASLATESFLSAASFQKTTKVLTDAAVKGKEDHLVGLKENVIIGRLIPAGTGMVPYREMKVRPTDGDLAAFERLLPADEDLSTEAFTEPRGVSVLDREEEEELLPMRERITSLADIDVGDAQVEPEDEETEEVEMELDADMEDEVDLDEDEDEEEE